MKPLLLLQRRHYEQWANREYLSKNVDSLEIHTNFVWVFGIYSSSALAEKVFHGRKNVNPLVVFTSESILSYDCFWNSVLYFIFCFACVFCRLISSAGSYTEVLLTASNNNGHNHNNNNRQYSPTLESNNSNHTTRTTIVSSSPPLRVENIACRFLEHSTYSVIQANLYSHILLNINNDVRIDDLRKEIEERFNIVLRFARKMTNFFSLLFRL